MSFDLSILTLTSAMARHASAAHHIAGQNIARADMPGATALEAPRFARMLQVSARGLDAAPRDSGRAIALDEQMAAAASASGQHATATTVWKKTLDLVRLAGAAPR